MSNILDITRRFTAVSKPEYRYILTEIFRLCCFLERKYSKFVFIKIKAETQMCSYFFMARVTGVEPAAWYDININSHLA